MATTLLDHLRSILTPSAASDLASTLGENQSATQKALDGLMPAVTAGVINRASNDEGAATLYHLLKSTPFDTDPSTEQLIKTDSHRRKAADSGNALLKQLFDDRVHRLSESAAQYSGVSTGSATTLTGLVMSILMGYLHRQVETRGLTEAQLAGLLRNEAEGVRGILPAALGGTIGWFTGVGTNRPVTTTTTTTTVPAGGGAKIYTDAEDKPAGFPWLRWLLIALGLLLLLFLLLRGCNRDKTETTTSSETTTVAADTVASDTNGNERAANADSAGANGPEVRVGVDLPGGRKLNVVENSFNYSLAKFLATKGGQTPKVFTFDNLTFETNSARITAKAQQNVNDLIEIMRAYPTLNIRIEGNTDSTGDDAVNDPLSAERAQAVKDALVKAGIEASRVTTRELGDRKPVATNQTEAGRQRNRRIDVVVTKL